MNKLVAAALLFAIIASPAFASKKPKQAHQKYDYSYRIRKTKYKAPKNHNHHSHAHKAGKRPSA